ncbi:hypothetical protein GCM10010174_56630 [Kutzneria viridogrisea]|uniref:Membrane associated rhomboid family serine protease n=1 Tax=Kutzneria viridogrisea TaxID=47990 RepID=A0ABR6BL00_9PSEU|nr:hypothetical protein [Kutzneria viridogrisea]
MTVRGFAKWLYGVLPRPRSTPFTFWYLVLLLVSTVLILAVPHSIGQHLLNWSSTDAFNLHRHPIRVLFASALWLAEPNWIGYVVVFAVAVAPLERRIGSWWTFAVFASGHVLGTLVTELPVMVAIKMRLLPHSDGHWIDVGVSYGFFATAGALLLVLPTRVRVLTWLGLLALIPLMVLGADSDEDAVITTVGHLVALHVGLLGWWPFLRRRGLIGSALLTLGREHGRGQQDPGQPEENQRRQAGEHALTAWPDPPPRAGHAQRDEPLQA